MMISTNKGIKIKTRDLERLVNKTKKMIEMKEAANATQTPIFKT